jgi:DNA polymerase III delta prime subunit
MNINWSIDSSQNKHYLKFLSEQIKSGSISNCYLFVGPKGVGKELIVTDFIKAIRCQSRDKRPCHNCRDCKKVDTETDQDLAIISSSDDSKTIKIDQIRKLKEKVNYRSIGKKNIFWIKNAQQLTNEAANSILKILEERSSAVFILSADRIDFPDTIESRAQVVYVSPDIPIEKKESKVEGYRSIFAESGLKYLDQSLDNKNIDLKKVHQFYQDLNNSNLSDRLGLVTDKILGFGLKDVFFLLILFEKSKFSRTKDSKSYRNLKMLMEAYQYASGDNLNKKILLKNVILSYQKP